MINIDYYDKGLREYEITIDEAVVLRDRSVWSSNIMITAVKARRVFNFSVETEDARFKESGIYDNEKIKKYNALISTIFTKIRIEEGLRDELDGNIYNMHALFPYKTVQDIVVDLAKGLSHLKGTDQKVEEDQI